MNRIDWFNEYWFKVEPDWFLNKVNALNYDLMTWTNGCPISIWTKNELCFKVNRNGFLISEFNDFLPNEFKKWDLKKNKEWSSKKDLYVILVFKVSFLMFNDGLQTKFEKEKILKMIAPTVHRVQTWFKKMSFVTIKVKTAPTIHRALTVHNTPTVHRV